MWVSRGRFAGRSRRGSAHARHRSIRVHVFAHLRLASGEHPAECVCGHHPLGVPADHLRRSPDVACEHALHRMRTPCAVPAVPERLSAPCARAAMKAPQRSWPLWPPVWFCRANRVPADTTCSPPARGMWGSGSVGGPPPHRHLTHPPVPSHLGPARPGPACPVPARPRPRGLAADPPHGVRRHGATWGTPRGSDRTLTGRKVAPGTAAGGRERPRSPPVRRVPERRSPP